jgi:hypothetical protein
MTTLDVVATRRAAQREARHLEIRTSPTNLFPLDFEQNRWFA